MPGIDFEMGLFLPSAADADGWNEMGENEFIPNVCSATAVNCVAAAGAAKWHEAYKTLFDQAHRFGLLPDDRRCAYAMLQEYGFIMQSGAMEGETIGAIYTLLEQKFDTGMLLLVQSGGGGQHAGLSHSPRACGGSAVPRQRKAEPVGLPGNPFLAALG